MSSDPPVSPTRQRRKDARPGELIAAAIDLFVERGFAATRLDDVAARAGVSKGTLYLYFDSKEALFQAAIREGLVTVMDDVDAIIDRYDGPTAELATELLLFWWRQVGSTRWGGIPKLLLSESRNFPETAAYYRDAVIRRGHHLVARVLQRGIARGELRPVDVPAAVEVLFAPLLLLTLWRHSFGLCGDEPGHPFNEPENFLRMHVELAMRGLLRHPA